MGKTNKKTDFTNQFMDVFWRLASKYGSHTVWEDFLTVSAISISNSFDFRQDREYKATQIMEKYKDELSDLSSLLTIVVLALKKNPRQDFLGSILMRLSLNKGGMGQILTPYHIAELMAKISSSQNEEKPFYTINDPCCGYGVMLIAARNEAMDQGQDIHRSIFCVAQDLDYTAAMGCYIQMSLLGIAGYVRVGDSIADPLCGTSLLADQNSWCTPMYYLPEWKMRRVFSCVNRS